MQSQVEQLRTRAFEEESSARRHRAKADALELEIIERRTAANALREIGITTGRNEDGVPWVKVEKTVLRDNDGAGTDQE